MRARHPESGSHRKLSGQRVSSAEGRHASSVGSQRSTVHAMPSSQTGGAPSTQPRASVQRSAPLQNVPSSQAASSVERTQRFRSHRSDVQSKPSSQSRLRRHSTNASTPTSGGASTWASNPPSGAGGSTGSPVREPHATTKTTTRQFAASAPVAAAPRATLAHARVTRRANVQPDRTRGARLTDQNPMVRGARGKGITSRMLSTPVA